MEKKEKIFLSVLLVFLFILIILSFNSFISNTTGFSVRDNLNQDFRECLNDKEIKIYGSKDCQNCQTQEQVEKNIEGAKFIDCDEEIGECAELEKLPACNIDGKIHYGEIELRDIYKILDCI